MDCTREGILKEASPPSCSWRSVAMFFSCPVSKLQLCSGQLGCGRCLINK